MRAQRIALACGVLLTLAALPAALDIAPAADGSFPFVAAAVAGLSVVIVVTVIASVGPAWRGSRPAARVAAGAVLGGALTAVPAFFAPEDTLPPGGTALASVGVIVSGLVFVGILLPVSTRVLHAVVVLFTIAAYALLTAAATLLLPDEAQRAAQTCAALAVAGAYAPVLAVVRRTVGRAVHGGRVDPSGTAREVGRRLRDTDDGPSASLAELRSALRFPRLMLTAGGHVLADSGTAPPGTATATVDIDTEAGVILEVTLRAGETHLGRDDRVALELVVPSMALLLRARALAAGLARARAATAEARERERSSLHRDLHDGLGPVLTGALYRADAARNQLREAPDAALRSLDAARDDLRDAIESVRRVAYGLRPIELEEHGLWQALTRKAGQHGRMTVAVDTPADQTPLSPAVALAGYRVASEAIANAARHSSGRIVRVRASVDATASAFLIEVTDDGEPPPQWTEGIGLGSLRDRVIELRGTVEAGPAPAGGWRVLAVIPLG